MAWFQKFCRGSGRLLHDVIHAGEKHRVVNKDIKERQVDQHLTLRRTTIDEVELKRPGNGTGHNAETPSQ